MGAQPRFPGPGDAVGRDCLGKGAHPNHHPSCSTSRRSRGRTKGPGEALGASEDPGKEATGAEGGDVPSRTKRAEGSFPLENLFPLGKPFPKGSSRARCGVQLVWKRHRQVSASGPAPGSLSSCWVRIQVNQESVPDQERGAWKIPSIYSVLVSPSGVFSVYLFFSREHGGP